MLSRLSDSQPFGISAKFGGPAQTLVYARPDQSMQRLGETHRRACPIVSTGFR